MGRASGGGGRGVGTHNGIVPLGGGYLEILAVADAGEAARSQLGRALAASIARTGEGLMGWAVAVDDVVPVAERLGTPVRTIVRQGLSARLTGVLEAMATPFCRSSWRATPESRVPAPRAVAAESSGSKWPAIVTGSMLGWAERDGRFVWSRVRLRSAQSRSAVGSSLGYPQSSPRAAASRAPSG